MNTAELGINQVLEAPRMFSCLRSVRQKLRTDVAVDLGTANTLIYVGRKGLVVNEPSVVATEGKSGRILAVGQAAKQMFGKTSKMVQCVRPLRSGVIADCEMASLMIRSMLSKAVKPCALQKHRAIIGVPSGITPVEKRAVLAAVLRGGISSVKMIEEPVAAAIGCGLDLNSGCANMIVDIGGGTTEIAVIHNGQVIYSSSIRIAGDQMDEAIQRHLRRHYELQMGIMEAERVKMTLGSALPLGQTRFASVYGRDMSRCLPQRIEVSDEVIRQALQEPILAIISTVVAALEQLKREAFKDIVKQGVYLAGGGALLKGLAERLYRETGIEFSTVEDPLGCVVRGVGMVVENLEQHRSFCIH